MNEFLSSRIEMAFLDNLRGDGYDPVDVDRFHVSVTIRHNSYNRREGASVVWARFSVLYNTVCEELLGKNNYRGSKAGKRPIVVALLDVEGTKYANGIKPTANPHIHSAWAIHPSHKDMFATVMERSERMDFVKRRFSIDSVFIQPFEDREDTNRIITYDSKFMKFNYRDLRAGKDFECYPRGKLH